MVAGSSVSQLGAADDDIMELALDDELSSELALGSMLDTSLEADDTALDTSLDAEDTALDTWLDGRLTLALTLALALALTSWASVGVAKDIATAAITKGIVFIESSLVGADGRGCHAGRSRAVLDDQQSQANFE